jgi:hypothetical protein
MKEYGIRVKSYPVIYDGIIRKFRKMGHGNGIKMGNVMGKWKENEIGKWKWK